MKKLIAVGTLISLLLGITSVILYKKFHDGFYISLAITAFTSLYHFVMRVVVACIVALVRKNKTAADALHPPLFLPVCRAALLWGRITSGKSPSAAPWPVAGVAPPARRS